MPKWMGVGAIGIVCLVLAASISGVSARSIEADDCPPSQFTAWGENGVVTPGDANNVRSEPSASAPKIGAIPPSEPFNVLYGARHSACADGYLWIEVQTATLRGWTVEIPAGDDAEPFIVPYVPEAREVGVATDDGGIRVEESGIAFTIPAPLVAALGVTRIMLVPEVGLFGDVMSAQPSSIKFTLLDDEDKTRGEIEVYPYKVYQSSYDILGYPALETMLSDQPPLLEYAAHNRMPQLPISGVAAVFGGAGAYTPFGSGSGLRYITYFAQAWVLFKADTTFEYLYRGVTSDGDFFVAAQDFPVKAPAGSLPANGSLDDDGYWRYIHQFEANLAAQPSSAFTPDLALYDALFASLTVTDRDALLDLIP